MEHVDIGNVLTWQIVMSDSQSLGQSMLHSMAMFMVFAFDPFNFSRCSSTLPILLNVVKQEALVHEPPQACHDMRARFSPPPPPLDGTETPFRKVHRKRATICMHFKNLNISCGQTSVDAFTGLQRPQKKHSPGSEFTPELHRWILKLM